MMTPTEWRAAHAEEFYLDPAEPERIEAWLHAAGVLATEVQVASATKAGEGNMNCTVRVVTKQRSLIVKQARPWVEKYPQFAAPHDRALREMDFYALVHDHPVVASRMPRVWHVDPEARVLVLEDLGRRGDFSDVYRGGDFTPGDIDALAGWLSALHTIRHGAAGRRGLANREMRALNHQHIFRIPLQPRNGLDLDAITPGLAAGAAQLQGDRALVAAFAALEPVYLDDGPCLVHGDFFPGSWLRAADGPRIIDPEFAYFGRPEYDAAVLLAHLLLARQKASLVQRWFERYQPPADLDPRIVLQLAGVEIIRRLIGYAQLPLALGTLEKLRLLDRARQLVLTPARELLE